MSVITTADEKIEQVKNNVTEAHKNLLVFLNPETWGHDEYASDYVDKLYEVATKLLEIKRLLK